MYFNYIFTYLGFSKVFSFLSFLSLWTPITRLSKDARLISDKTKISYFLFPRGQVSSFGYFSWRVSQTPEYEFIQRRSFFLSVFSGILWNLGFFRIQTTCLLSSKNKRPLVIFCSLKNDHVLAFWWFYSFVPTTVAVCLTPLMHT